MKYVGKSKCLPPYFIRKGTVSPTIHAEHAVLKKISCDINSPKQKDRYDILVFRFNRSGELAESRPCQHCIHKLKKYNINRVFYSSKNGDIICEKVSEMDISTAHVTSGIKFIHEICKSKKENVDPNNCCHHHHHHDHRNRSIRRKRKR